MRTSSRVIMLNSIFLVNVVQYDQISQIGGSVYKDFRPFGPDVIVWSYLCYLLEDSDNKLIAQRRKAGKIVKPGTHLMWIRYSTRGSDPNDVQFHPHDNDVIFVVGSHSTVDRFKISSRQVTIKLSLSGLSVKTGFKGGKGGHSITNQAIGIPTYCTSFTSSTSCFCRCPVLVLYA